MVPLQIRNLFTDQNQTQHNSLRSKELLKGPNSSSADQRGPSHKRSTYKPSVSFFLLCLFYFVRFLVQRPAKPAGPILTIYTSNDAVSHKVLTFAKTSEGVIPPKKTLQNWASILAQVCPIGAAWRKKFKNLNEITNNPF